MSARFAALFIDLLPAWRVSGGMGATHLLEGFDRCEVRAHMQLIGLTPAEQKLSWGFLADLEKDYRKIRSDAEKQKTDNSRY